MNTRLEDQLSKSRTTYRNLHQTMTPTKSSIRMQMESQLDRSDDENDNDDDDDDERQTTLPTFVNRFFFPKTTKKVNPTTVSNNGSGMFRAIRGQVIIHHDDERPSKVQREDDGDMDAEDGDDEEDDEELQTLSVHRSSAGNYELHYDVDNPLEISCSMSLSSAETVSDHSPSPNRQTSLININGNRSTIQRVYTPVKLNDAEEEEDEEEDDTPPLSTLSDSDQYQSKQVIDRPLTIREQDEKLRTFRGWHLSMLRQIDEKLREIEQESVQTPIKNNQPSQTKNLTFSSSKTTNNKKKIIRPAARRRLEPTVHKRQHSPIPTHRVNTLREKSPIVEKESRTLIINLPPSSSSSSPSDIEPEVPKTAQKPIHIRIIPSPSYPMPQRSSSTEHMLLRDQSAQTEPLNQLKKPFEHRPARPASVEGDRVLASHSLTRAQGAQFLQQHASRNSQPAQFFSLRSRSASARPTIIPVHAPQINTAASSQSPGPVRSFTPQETIETTVKHSPIPPADPLVYSDDYGHVTQMDTSNLGTLVDRVFDDIYQDKASDFYRDYRQLLNDIQIRFSSITEPTPVVQCSPHPPPPPPPVVHRAPPPPPPPSSYIHYPHLSQTIPTQGRLCDTLIYIPDSH